jgi:hypothetical protein
MMNRVIAASGATAVVLLAIAVTPAAQAQRGAPPAGRGAPATPQAASGYNGPRTSDGKPDWNGIWQVFGTAHEDLEAHSATEGTPGGMSVVEGGRIPYQPTALAKRNENRRTRMESDPIRKCYQPGVPRVMLLPFPFQIIQTPTHFGMTHEFAHAMRMVYLDGTPPIEDNEFYMGDSRGRWEGDTLVVSTVSLRGDLWLDKSGNYHSEALRVVERFTPMDATHINYEATLEDPKTFTRPWKINTILYKRLEKDLELLDYECVEHVYLKLFKELVGTEENRRSPEDQK